MQTRSKMLKKAFTTAFPYTIPIFAGFWFLGITYGIYMNVSGFSFWYPMLMSVTIFAGSIEFVTVNMLLGAFNPLQAFVMTLMINARHLFYGISMLDKFRGTGRKKFYLIFGMCDETFSINYTADIPEDVDRGWFMFFVTLLNHFYWFSGATLGGIFGSLINFNTEGLEFVMTAMFVVIFLEQWLKEKDHTSSLIGLGISILCLIACGADNFIIPAMLAILGVLTLMRHPFERKESVESKAGVNEVEDSRSEKKKVELSSFEKEEMRNDTDTADHNSCNGSARHGGNAISSFSYLSGREGDAEVRAVSRKGAPGGGIRTAGRLQPERREHPLRKPRYTGADLDCFGHSPACVETADASVHCWWYGVLHAACAVCFLNCKHIKMEKEELFIRQRFCVDYR